MAQTVALIRAANQRVELATRAIALAKKNIVVEQARFDLGKSTNFDVLLRQDELRQAQLRLAQAQVDWHKAQAVIAALTGTILDDYGIALASRSERGIAAGSSASARPPAFELPASPSRNRRLTAGRVNAGAASRERADTPPGHLARRHLAADREEAGKDGQRPGAARRLNHSAGMTSLRALRFVTPSCSPAPRLRRQRARPRPPRPSPPPTCARGSTPCCRRWSTASTPPRPRPTRPLRRPRASAACSPAARRRPRCPRADDARAPASGRFAGSRAATAGRSSAPTDGVRAPASARLAGLLGGVLGGPAGAPADGARARGIGGRLAPGSAPDVRGLVRAVDRGLGLFAGDDADSHMGAIDRGPRLALAPIDHGPPPGQPAPSAAATGSASPAPSRARPDRARDRTRGAALARWLDAHVLTDDTYDDGASRCRPTCCAPTTPARSTPRAPGRSSPPTSRSSRRGPRPTASP